MLTKYHPAQNDSLSRRTPKSDIANILESTFTTLKYMYIVKK